MTVSRLEQAVNLASDRAESGPCQSVGQRFSHSRTCSMRSAVEMDSAGNGQRNRSLAASWPAPPRVEGFAHNCTNRLMALARRQRRFESDSASAWDCAASANNSAQPTTHSMSIRPSTSPSPRVIDSSPAIRRTIGSLATGILDPPRKNGGWSARPPDPADPDRHSPFFVRRAGHIAAVLTRNKSFVRKGSHLSQAGILE
jgi:hypothetical protein